MKKWHELGIELRRYVNPQTFPVAVRILKEKSKRCLLPFCLVESPSAWLKGNGLDWEAGSKVAL